MHKKKFIYYTRPVKINRYNKLPIKTLKYTICSMFNPFICAMLIEYANAIKLKIQFKVLSFQQISAAQITIFG